MSRKHMLPYEEEKAVIREMLSLMNRGRNSQERKVKDAVGRRVNRLDAYLKATNRSGGVCK